MDTAAFLGVLSNPTVWHVSPISPGGMCKRISEREVIVTGGSQPGPGSAPRPDAAAAPRWAPGPDAGWRGRVPGPTSTQTVEVMAHTSIFGSDRKAESEWVPLLVCFFSFLFQSCVEHHHIFCFSCVCHPKSSICLFTLRVRGHPLLRCPRRLPRRSWHPE